MSSKVSQAISTWLHFTQASSMHPYVTALGGMSVRFISSQRSSTGERLCRKNEFPPAQECHGAGVHDFLFEPCP